ncbi:MAG: aldo/keto reductase [Eubacteriales bacterium]|nr:aldo/keto reductase [Eubacteriales bacterium]
MIIKPLGEVTTLKGGVKMPSLGLGVWQVNDGDEVINAVSWALEAGYRSIDTAMIYGNEEGVGKALRESSVQREEVFVTTKVWNGDQGYESTLKAFEESRRRLGLEYIDLYLIHWPINGKYVDTWKAMIHLYKEGYVRAIGVSNFLEKHIDDIIDATGQAPAVNQVEMHPLYTRKPLLNFCVEKDIRVTAWSPLMQGKLDIPVILELSKKYGKTPAQIVLRWHLQNGVIVIPKSVKKHRIIENSQIFDFDISKEDMERIDGLNQNKNFGSTVEDMNR